MTKLVIYVFLLLAVLYLMFTLGFKLLINSSLFISNLFSKNQKTVEQVKKDDDFFESLKIDDVPTATSSSSIIISGTSLNFDILEFYLNDEKIKETQTVSSGTFSEIIESLEKGNNTIYVIAKKTDSDKEKQSSEYTVSYTTEKPKLEITGPADGTKTSKEDITISGETDKNVSISVNGMPAVVDAVGQFKLSLRLKEGENNIEVNAQNSAGNTETKTLKVTYQKD